jgi:hypothetical protein
MSTYRKTTTDFKKLCLVPFVCEIYQMGNEDPTQINV